ncbi:hypothetical protein [Micromonospora sp. HM5-17]|uniref:hypothetical protein n=1 Tax=Micromonospora sp. HM5-17 TaxID=2487710 RepID=UPI000F4775A8|nr:hypothetical protein [Micromonospora sp. HM5-17]ROT29825.1 hypothetical protein EF879_19695 [Micromonospora sp. HM5-17]
MSEQHGDRVEYRADHLLPEERSVGSDDPEAQAAAILAESDRREAGAAALAESDPRTDGVDRHIAEASAAPDSFLERRRSDQTVSPPEPPD